MLWKILSKHGRFDETVNKIDPRAEYIMVLFESYKRRIYQI